MKKNYLFVSTIRVLLICCVFSTTSLAALTGSYTINASSAASATNYQSFQSAVSDLLTGTRADGGPANGAGVSGPVIFTVAAGTYSGQLDITGSITGASAVNTITFDGIDAATRIIEYNSTNSASRHTIRLAGVSYLTFRNLTIRTLGTYGWAIHLNAANTNSITIKKCIVNMTGAGIGISTPTHVGILLNANTINLGSSGYYCDSILIDSNTILNGYYGIALMGGQVLANYQLNSKITHNSIVNSSNAGIYAAFQNGMAVENNTISPYRISPITGSGININNIISTSANRVRVSGNTIHKPGSFGINMVDVFGSPAGKGYIYNNMVNDGFGSGLKMETCEYLDICNNTFTIRNGFDGIDAGCFVDGGTGLMLYNNIFSISQTSPLLPLYASDRFAFDSIDYNILYRHDISNAQLLFIGVPMLYNSFAGMFGFNTHSLFKKPEFLNDTNGRVSNGCDKGFSIPYISLDIDNSARNLPPTIGAHEGIFLRHNLLVKAIESPTYPFTTGLHDLVVSVQNLGDSIIGSFDISYIHNSAAPITQTFSGTLNPCDTTWIVFTGANQVDMVASNSFQIYTSLPNGVGDPQRANDTLTISIYAPLNGHYIIGSSTTAHFSSFNAAVSALKTAGVAGPVIFEVEPGTYSERVSIDTDIPGTSFANTITFDGIDATTRILNNSNADENILHTFQIASNYVRLRNLTIRASDTDYGWGVLISKRNAKNIHIKNCIIDIVNAQATESFVGIGICGAPSFYYEDPFRVDSIEIDSNIIRNGFAGIVHKNFMYGTEPPSTRLSFRNNTLYNHTQYGIFSEKANGTFIHGNSIIMNKSEVENVTGISLSYSEAPNSSYNLVITSNIIRNVNNSGIDIFTAHNTSTNRGLIANNAIISSGYNGIYVDDASYLDIVNNSVKLDAFVTFPRAGALNISGSTALGVLNNHLIVDANGSAAGALVCDNSSALSSCNFNNIYKSTSTNVVYLGGWYSHNSYVGVGGFNLNSFSVNPHFQNDSTLIPLSSCIKGTFVAGITKDINDSSRNTPPDVGAYERTNVSNDLAVIELLSPKFPIDSGMQNLEVLIANHGNNPILNGTVGYILNGGTPVLQSFSTILNSCDTLRIIFSGVAQIHISNGIPNSLKVFCANPNSVADLNPSNDTLSTELQTPLIGVYTIGAIGADFSTLNDARIALGKRGISGDVVFKIKTGTYTEQVTLEEVTGASDTSTISFISEANHPDSVIIQYSPTSVTSNYIIRSLGASYYTFRKLTISSNRGKAIELLTTSSYITIDSCRISCNSVTSTSGFNAGAGIYTGQEFNGSHLTITHNIITGAMAGVYIYGSSSLSLSDSNIVAFNSISGAYFAALYFNNTSNLKVIRNTITSNSTYPSPYGIYCFVGNDALELKANKITMTTGGYGINLQNCVGRTNAYALVATNVIIVSGSKVSYGIRNQASSYVRIYHNSILVNSSINSFAGYFHYNGNAFRYNEIKNNVFANIGTGVAIYLLNPAPILSNVESDYNNIYATGTNLLQSGSPNALHTNLHTWRTVSLRKLEMNSVSYRPGFTSNNNLTPNISDSACWSLNGRGTHLDSIVIREDINGIVRPLSTIDGTPDIGAYEFKPTAIPPTATAIPLTPVAGTTQAFLFASDTVATISWDVSSTVPSSVKIKFYSGESTPSLSPTEYHTKAYWSILADTGFYTYNLALYYKNSMLGNLPYEADMRPIQRVGNTPWNLISFSSVDTVKNILTGMSLTDFSMVITGTDNNSPLPVSFNFFRAKLYSSDVILNWSTTSENQVNGFTIERLNPSGKWEDIGFVKGAGNSNVLRQYSFTDSNPFSLFSGESVLYYRLRQTDYNKDVQYSSVVSVRRTSITQDNLIVYPNPFHSTFTLLIDALKEEKVDIEMFNVHGKHVLSQSLDVPKGSYSSEITNINHLEKGIYFVRVTLNGENKVIKLLKE